MKIKLVSKFNGIIELKSGVNYTDKPIRLAGKKSITFKNADAYQPYSECVSALMKSGLIEFVKDAGKNDGKKGSEKKAPVTKPTKPAKPQMTLDEVKKKMQSLKDEFDNEQITDKRKKAIKKEVAELKKLAKELK